MSPLLFRGFLWPFPDLIAHRFLLFFFLSFLFDLCDRLSWFNLLLNCTLNSSTFLSLTLDILLTGFRTICWGTSNGLLLGKPLQYHLGYTAIQLLFIIFFLFFFFLFFFFPVMLCCGYTLVFSLVLQHCCYVVVCHAVRSLMAFVCQEIKGLLTYLQNQKHFQ